MEYQDFLIFDTKSFSRNRIKEDKFALNLKVWNHFIEILVSCYKLSQNITINKQLFSSKTHCPFTRFITSKSEKYGRKIWIPPDLESKYVLNEISYLEQNQVRD